MELGFAAMQPLPTVGHVVRTWLPGSATFVHNVVAHQRRWRPVVLAGEITRADEFPVEDLVAFGPAEGRVRGTWQRAVAARAGFRSPFDHRLVVAARRRRCSVLHAHFGTIGYRALVARERLGVPLVTTFYGFDLAMPAREPGWDRHYARLFSEGALFVVEGPHMAKTLERLGAPADRIRVVRIGLDLALFPFEPRTPARPLILLQGARLTAKKGVDLSIRAFAAARPRLGDAELWIVGDGPERSQLERLAASERVAAHVRFLGALPYARYRDAVRRAHICLQPSRTAPDGDTEGGAPTVILEMQASGMPVVATRHADIPFVAARPDELVAEEDVDGLAERIVLLAGLGAAEWRERAERAREIVAREHDTITQAARIEALYDEVVI